MYGKLFEQELDSSIVELPLATRLLWHYLIMLADEDGNVDMAPTALARRVNIPLTDVEDALQALSSPDYDSRTPDEDGRRIVPLRDQGYGWHLVNHGKYREIASRSERRTYMRRYMRIYREEHAGKQSVNSGKQLLGPQTQMHTQTQTQRSTFGACPATPPSGEAEPPPPVALRFPVKKGEGGETTWKLTTPQVARFADLYEITEADALAACKRALAWVEAQEGQRRKTARGMPRFLDTWIRRDNDKGVFRKDRGGGRGGGFPSSHQARRAAGASGVPTPERKLRRNAYVEEKLAAEAARREGDS